VACLLYNLPFLLCHLTPQKAMSLDNLCALFFSQRYKTFDNPLIEWAPSVCILTQVSLYKFVVVTYSITVPNVSQHDAVSFSCLQQKNFLSSIIMTWRNKARYLGIASVNHLIYLQGTGFSIMWDFRFLECSSGLWFS